MCAETAVSARIQRLPWFQPVKLKQVAPEGILGPHSQHAGAFPEPVVIEERRRVR